MNKNDSNLEAKRHLQWTTLMDAITTNYVPSEAILLENYIVNDIDEEEYDDLTADYSKRAIDTESELKNMVNLFILAHKWLYFLDKDKWNEALAKYKKAEDNVLTKVTKSTLNKYLYFNLIMRSDERKKVDNLKSNIFDLLVDVAKGKSVHKSKKELKREHALFVAEYNKLLHSVPELTLLHYLYCNFKEWKSPNLS